MAEAASSKTQAKDVLTAKDMDDDKSKTLWPQIYAD
jgi:hypothetical protein